MSLCMLIAADKPLPLCDKKEERSKTVEAEGEMFTVSTLCGFSVEEHCYYRDAVNALDYPIKDYQYELSLEEDETDLQNLKDYLLEQFAPGEEVELWSIWLGGYEGKKAPVFQKLFIQELDMDAIHTLCNGCLQECRLSITI